MPYSSSLADDEGPRGSGGLQSNRRPSVQLSRVGLTLTERRKSVVNHPLSHLCLQLEERAYLVGEGRIKVLLLTRLAPLMTSEPARQPLQKFLLLHLLRVYLIDWDQQVRACALRALRYALDGESLGIFSKMKLPQLVLVCFETQGRLLAERVAAFRVIARWLWLCAEKAGHYEFFDSSNFFQLPLLIGALVENVWGKITDDPVRNACVELLFFCAQKFPEVTGQSRGFLVIVSVLMGREAQKWGDRAGDVILKSLKDNPIVRKKLYRNGCFDLGLLVSPFLNFMKIPANNKNSNTLSKFASSFSGLIFVAQELEAIVQAIALPETSGSAERIDIFLEIVSFANTMNFSPFSVLLVRWLHSCGLGETISMSPPKGSLKPVIDGLRKLTEKVGLTNLFKLPPLSESEVISVNEIFPSFVLPQSFREISEAVNPVGRFSSSTDWILLNRLLQRMAISMRAPEYLEICNTPFLCDLAKILIDSKNCGIASMLIVASSLSKLSMRNWESGGVLVWGVVPCLLGGVYSSLCSWEGDPNEGDFLAAIIGGFSQRGIEKLEEYAIFDKIAFLVDFDESLVTRILDSIQSDEIVPSLEKLIKKCLLPHRGQNLKCAAVRLCSFSSIIPLLAEVSISRFSLGSGNSAYFLNKGMATRESPTKLKPLLSTDKFALGVVDRLLKIMGSQSTQQERESIGTTLIGFMQYLPSSVILKGIQISRFFFDGLCKSGWVAEQWRLVSRCESEISSILSTAWGREWVKQNPLVSTEKLIKCICVEDLEIAMIAMEISSCLIQKASSIAAETGVLKKLGEVAMNWDHFSLVEKAWNGLLVSSELDAKCEGILSDLGWSMSLKGPVDILKWLGKFRLYSPRGREQLADPDLSCESDAVDEDLSPSSGREARNSYSKDVSSPRLRRSKTQLDLGSRMGRYAKTLSSDSSSDSDLARMDVERLSAASPMSSTPTFSKYGERHRDVLRQIKALNNPVLSRSAQSALVRAYQNDPAVFQSVPLWVRVQKFIAHFQISEGVRRLLHSLFENVFVHPDALPYLDRLK